MEFSGVHDENCDLLIRINFDGEKNNNKKKHVYLLEKYNAIN